MRTVWLLVGLVLLCGCHTTKKPSGPRVIQLSIAADEEFRARPDWEKHIRERVQKVSEAWAPLGVRWEVAVVNPWLSNNNAGPDLLWAALRGGTPGGSAILLGVSGQKSSDNSLGFVAPFTKILVVYDFPDQSESNNAAILSHQLARLFGAWDVSDPNSVMNARPTTLQFDPQTAELIGLAKDVDFMKGITGMEPSVTEAIAAKYRATNGKVTDSPVFQAHLRAGEELMRARRMEAALGELGQAAKMAPDNARTHQDMAVTLASMNELSAAIREFREVVRIEPSSPLAHANLGSLLTRTGNWRDGNAEVRKGVELSPRDAGLRFTLGSVLMQTPGQLDAGIAEVREGLRLSPDSAVGKSLLEGAERYRSRAAK